MTPSSDTSIRSLLRRAAIRVVGPQRLVEMRRRRLRPRIGAVDFGDLRRTAPIAPEFGFERGDPVDRHYIGRFIRDRAQAGDVRGRVLEFGDLRYVDETGSHPGANPDVEAVDVLDIDRDNPRATITGDLAAPPALPADAFDCIICTQVLHYVSDLRAAVEGLHQMLAPGGVALVTVPGIAQIATDGPDRWRFSTRGALELFGAVFGPENVVVGAHGNVLSAVAFLHGLARSELTDDELEVHDPVYELLITVRAVKG